MKQMIFLLFKGEKLMLWDCWMGQLSSQSVQNQLLSELFSIYPHGDLQLCCVVFIFGFLSLSRLPPSHSCLPFAVKAASLKNPERAAAGAGGMFSGECVLFLSCTFGFLASLFGPMGSFNVAPIVPWTFSRT